jgi:carboxylesterase type B
MKVKNLIMVLTPTLAAAAPTVNLGYSEYLGVGLPNVNEFLGLRYAAPPTGNLRWRAPSAPATISGVQSAVAVSSSSHHLIT